MNEIISLDSFKEMVSIHTVPVEVYEKDSMPIYRVIGRVVNLDYDYGNGMCHLYIKTGYSIDITEVTLNEAIKLFNQIENPPE